MTSGKAKVGMGRKLDRSRRPAPSQDAKDPLETPAERLLPALGWNIARMPATRRPRPKPTPQQIKVLWGVGAICARPGCGKRLVQEATAHDPAAVIGKMAHIKAFSPEGPRHDPTLSAAEVDSADNLILLCPNDHDIVDAQDSTYTVQKLHDWKRKQEAFILDAIGARVRAVGFQELEAVTQGLLAVPGKPLDSLALPLRPEEKMPLNGLTAKVSDILNAGYLRFEDVQGFVSRTETVQPGYADALTEGFRRRYRELVGQGLTGDAVFFELAEWSAAGNVSFDRKAAGVAVLTYLFHICEVFES
jgi:hypothetical protein